MNPKFLTCLLITLISIMPLVVFAQEDDREQEEEIQKVLENDRLREQQLEENRPRETQTDDAQRETQAGKAPTSDAEALDASKDGASETQDSKRTSIPTEDMSEQSRIVRDIRLSSFFELVVWLRSLNLSTSGSRSELEKRLFEHYTIHDSLINVTEEESTDSNILVVVDSAREFKFFQTDTSNEEYIRLDGGVIISIENKSKNVKHIIKSDSLIINLDINILTALGDIQYILKRGDGSEERFDGDSMTFNFKNLEGIFLGGQVFTKNELDKSSTDDFVFKGKTVSRTEDDVVIFDGVQLSSADDMPYYSLRGSKFWLLADNEWALVNAALYVGNIPVFYIPFFFKNADRLFFRPAIGLHTQKGPYINTTTYFFGKPVEQEESFSVLQVTSQGDGDTDRVIDGFFLRPRENSTPAEDAARKNWLLKFMFDGYSRMGMYTGVEGSFDTLNSIKKLEFRFGLGASRAIFAGEGDYTNYVVQDNKVQAHWQSSYLFSTPIPYLRYELATSVNGSIQSSGSWSLDFEWYSDRTFTKDFHTREEQFSWGFLLGKLIDEEHEEAEKSEKTAFSWDFSSSYRPSLRALSPWVKINIQRLNVSVDWKSKERNSESLPDILTGRTLYSHPEKYFFYPAYLKAPDLAVSISGTLLNYRMPTSIQRQERKLAEDTSSEGVGQGELDPPWEEDEQEIALDNDAEESEFQLADLQGNAKDGISFPSAFSALVGYKINSSFAVNNVTQNKNWEEPEDIDINDLLGYSMLEQENTGTIDYSLGFINKRLVIDGKLGFSVDYYDLLSLKEELYSENERQSLLKDQYRNRAQTITHTLKTRLYPLNTFPVFSGTNFAHTLENIIYSHELDTLVDDEPEYADKYASWDDEMITKHSFAGTFSTKKTPFSQSLSLELGLPPLVMTLEPKWTLGIGSFSASIYTTIKDLEAEEIEYEPLVTTASYSFSPWLRISQRLTTDINENELISSATSLSLYFLQKKLSFTTKLDASKSQDLVFNTEDFDWNSDEDSADTLRLQSLSFSGSLNHTIGPFWKNRISLGLNGSFNVKYKFLDFTENDFTLSYGLKLSIYRFLTLSVKVNVKNDQIYRYSKKQAAEVDVSHRNFFEDIGYSLNVFSTDDLHKSLFKLQSVTVSLDHDLRDWTLNLAYTGKYAADSGTNEIQWQNILNISVQWKPISELSTKWRVEDGDLSLIE